MILVQAFNGGSYIGSQKVYNATLCSVLVELLNFGYRMAYANKREICIVSIYDNQHNYILTIV